MCQMSVFWRLAPVEKSGVAVRSTADVRPGPTLGRNQPCYRRITPVSESDARSPLTSSLVSHAGCVICVLSVGLFATLSADTGRADLIFWFGATRPTFGVHQAFEHAIMSSWHAGKASALLEKGETLHCVGCENVGEQIGFVTVHGIGTCNGALGARRNRAEISRLADVSTGVNCGRVGNR